MAEPSSTIEVLRWWSQLLLWVSVILPLLGGVAAGARYYVERREKALSSGVTVAAIEGARGEALAAQQALERFKQQAAPRTISPSQHLTLVTRLAPVRGRPVSIACRMMDGESCDLALRLADSLRAAGLLVPEIIKTSLNDFPGRLAVTAHGRVDHGEAELLAGALTEAGLSASVEQVAANSIGAWYPDTTCIVVGRKS